MLLKQTSIICIVLFSFSLAAFSFAAVPQTINYQGYLKNTDGSPVTGSAPMTFSLYSSSPPRNNPLWVEPVKQVTVTNGIYSTTVGSTTNPITAPFDVPYFLGINVNGSDLPLQPLSSVPYAQRAAVADSVMANAVSNAAISGQIQNSKLDLSTVVAKAGDTMTGALTLPFNGLTVGTNQIVVSGGKVGIGTATPGFTLDVVGTGRVTSNFDLTAAISQIGFNRNSTNGRIYNAASKAWQMGSSGAAQNDEFTISSWNTDESPLALVLKMTPVGNATFTGTVTAGGTIETTSGGIKFPDGAMQTSAKTDCMGRYEDNNDGTVTDCRTGLIWLKDANCLETSGGIAKSGGYLSWADAVTWAVGLGNTICGLSDGSSAGDWRLPTKTEWMAMVASARKQLFTLPALTNRAGTAKWSEGDPFVAVQSYYYWSATSGASDTSFAWVVYVNNGYAYDRNKTFSNIYVWPVRSGQ